MEYTINSLQDAYVGTGATKHDAVLDAITQLATREFQSLSHGKELCRIYIRSIADKKKSNLISGIDNYTDIEIIEIMMETRDYAITGNTTPARYPIANSLAQARGTTLAAVLTSWKDTLASAFTMIANISHKESLAISAINGASTPQELVEIMANIIEQID